MASCAAIGNRRACRLPTGTQLAKLSGMGLRPTEVHENPLDRRPTVDKVSNRIGDRYPPYTRVGFRPCPTKGQLHAVAVLERLRDLPDSHIDHSDAPERIPRASDLQVGRFYRPIKQLVSIRVDADVLAWFRGHGKKYQTYMNEVLRREMQTNARGR
jgi:uncharacterized protein (DUF4415 family)